MVKPGKKMHGVATGAAWEAVAGSTDAPVGSWYTLGSLIRAASTGSMGEADGMGGPLACQADATVLALAPASLCVAMRCVLPWRRVLWCVACYAVLSIHRAHHTV